MNGKERWRILAALLLLAIVVRRPALAQVDLAGDWGIVAGEREGSPELGDYLGLPINEAARVNADTWESSRLSELERQCMPHVSPSISRAPFPMRVSMERDSETHQVVAVKFFFKFMEQTQTVWMDGCATSPATALHLDGFFDMTPWDGMPLSSRPHIKRGYLRGAADSGRKSRPPWSNTGCATKILVAHHLDAQSA